MEQRVDHMKYMSGMEVIESNVMDQVISKMEAYNYEKYTAQHVLMALKKEVLDIEDFAALLSPQAMPFLEEMAKRAKLETRKHFGNSVYMFTPLYIANYCENYCIYCGFNCYNKIKRARLNAEEIEKKCKVLLKLDYKKYYFLLVKVAACLMLIILVKLAK